MPPPAHTLPDVQHRVTTLAWEHYGTLKALAEASGVSPSVLSSLHKHRPRVENVRAIARALGTSVPFLLYGRTI